MTMIVSIMCVAGSFLVKGSAEAIIGGDAVAKRAWAPDCKARRGELDC